jgi:hypothetical protein
MKPTSTASRPARLTILSRPWGSCRAGSEDQLRDLALRATATGETLRLLTAWAACHILHPAYERTAARDGRVSIEIDPRISADPDRTAAEARGLRWLVDRPNMFIKIPATLAALPAITASLAGGTSVKSIPSEALRRWRVSRRGISERHENIMAQVTVEIVKRSDRAEGFTMLPRRWVVERTFAYLNRCRGLARDCKCLNRKARVASLRLVLRG